MTDGLLKGAFGGWEPILARLGARGGGRTAETDETALKPLRLPDLMIFEADLASFSPCQANSTVPYVLTDDITPKLIHRPPCVLNIWVRVCVKGFWQRANPMTSRHKTALFSGPVNPE